jgi:hypothetical protein
MQCATTVEDRLGCWQFDKCEASIATAHVVVLGSSGREANESFRSKELSPAKVKPVALPPYVQDTPNSAWLLI